MIHSFYFWASLIILISIITEKLYPRFSQQKTARSKFLIQDISWLILNLWLFWKIIAPTSQFFRSIAAKIPFLSDINILSDQNLLLQVLCTIIIKDFIEYLIHNLLHRINFLWQFHKVHHSLEEMNWLGNTRFHPFESLFYDILKYTPMALLGTSNEALLIVGSFSYLIGSLNHCNCSFSYGPLKYILNSPAMHIWHHDRINHKNKGQNFGVVFSTWDFIFRTAHFPPNDTPQKLGFKGDKNFPKKLIARLIYPLIKKL